MQKHYIGKEFEVKIDRPLGSAHPKYKNCIYPINYGYLPNTVAGDGKEIDVYVIRENSPQSKLKVKIVAAILRENDVEFKLVAAPIDKSENVTIDEIKIATNFMEQYFKSSIIM